MQKSEGYLELERETKKADGTIFTKADDVGLVNSGLAHVFQDGRISTSSGTEMNKVNKRSGFINHETVNTYGWRSIILFRWKWWKRKRFY